MISGAVLEKAQPGNAYVYSRDKRTIPGPDDPGIDARPTAPEEPARPLKKGGGLHRERRGSPAPDVGETTVEP